MTKTSKLTSLLAVSFMACSSNSLDGVADSKAMDPAPEVVETCSTYDETTEGTARILDVFALPPTPLAVIAPNLTNDDLSSALARGAVTTDAPGLGSGLELVGDCPLRFVMVPDRGPNGDRGDDEKFFPMPAFSPSIVEVTAHDARIEIKSALPITADDGAPVTGLSNTANDDVPFETAEGTTVLPLNENGLDTEDVRRLPNGDFVVADEYSPSVVVIDGSSGRVRARFTPRGVTLPKAEYRVRDILPSVFASRRLNKGFESLALSQDGAHAYVLAQTPLGDEDDYGSSRVVRILMIENVGDPENARVGGQWIMIESDVSEYPDMRKQSKVYTNSATWIAPHRLLVLERGQKRLKVFDVDLHEATNFGETFDDLTLEAASVDTLSIVPATRTLVFDSIETPEFISTPSEGTVAPEKLEGLALINRATIAIANDNDFGIFNANDRSRIWIIRLAAALTFEPSEPATMP